MYFFKRVEVVAELTALKHETEQVLLVAVEEEVDLALLSALEKDAEVRFLTVLGDLMKIVVLPFLFLVNL